MPVDEERQLEAAPISAPEADSEGNDKNQAGGQGTQLNEFSPQEVAKNRRENASLRERLRAAESKNSAYETAQKTAETEKAQKDGDTQKLLELSAKENATLTEQIAQMALTSRSNALNSAIGIETASRLPAAADKDGEARRARQSSSMRAAILSDLGDKAFDKDGILDQKAVTQSATRIFSDFHFEAPAPKKQGPPRAKDRTVDPGTPKLTPLGHLESVISDAVDDVLGS